MQSDQEELKNLQKLTEKLKSSRCVLCGHKLFPSAYIIKNLDQNKMYVECMSCMTIYDNNLEIDSVGLPAVHGVS